MMSSRAILGEVDLGMNKPALDPIIIDCIGFDDLPRRVKDVYAIICSRLTNANMINGAKIVFIAQSNIIELFTNSCSFELCKDQYTGNNNAYLLTLSANGNQLIAPPLGMTWDDYFLSLKETNTPIKPIRVLAPWAQAKFLNIEVIK